MRFIHEQILKLFLFQVVLLVLLEPIPIKISHRLSSLGIKKYMIFSSQCLDRVWS